MPSAALPVLDLSLRRRDAQQYEIDLRFNDPANPVEDRLIAACGPFDRAAFQKLETDASETGAYGKLLARNLLGDAGIAGKFEKWGVGGQPLRFRFYIEPSALDVDNLRWEALADPRNGNPLFNGELNHFSRFLTSNEWRLVQQRARTSLKALVAIANPGDLAEAAITLAPVDSAGEMARAKQGLGAIPVTALTPESPTGRATLAKICDQLRSGGFDILYLVCHGAFRDPGGGSDPVIWLEDDQARSEVVDTAAFVTELGKLATLPRLVVLASCQSSGTGRTADTAGSLTSFAPRLSAAGVPAVVAMQGNILMDTIAKFMPVFFSELSSDGSIDRAVAVARGKIGSQSDYWAPVLYTRLKDAAIWYEPGFAPGDFKGFPALLSSARSGGWAPLLGAGMTENLFGQQREVVRRFAEDAGFALASYDRDNLPSVAQYLATTQNRDEARDKYVVRLARELRGRFPTLDGADWSEFGVLYQAFAQGEKQRWELQRGLNQRIEAAGRVARQAARTEPHRVLASKLFNCNFYVTTNPDTLLEAALREAGREPQVNYCRWFEDLSRDASIAEADDPWPLDYAQAGDSYIPTDPAKPLVYHLFGLWGVPKSLVLTEDDYFDYLIGATRNNALLPTFVRARLADTALLFLGFHIDEWSFRVLFRQLANIQGNAANVGSKQHIGAQIGPDQDRAMDVQKARAFFEDYVKGNKTSLYWGSVEDLTKGLLAEVDQQVASAAGVF